MEEYNNGQQQGFQSFQAGVSQAEEARKEGYGTALNMMEQRHVAQRRERDRLALKYGEKHERVAAMDRRLAGNTLVGKATKTQASRAANPAAAPQAGQWKMMGRVVNDKGEALPGLTISLFGKNGWERALGHTCTDDAGNYSLLVADPKLVSQYGEQELLPTVTDGNKDILHQAQESVTLGQGGLALRHMVISSKKCTAPGDMYGVWSDMPPSHESDNPEGGMVWGMVRTALGYPAIGLRVRATALRNKTTFQLGKEDTTDQQGKYVINFGPEDVGLHAFEGDLTIAIHLYNAEGTLLLETPFHEVPPYASRIDLNLDEKQGKV